jgi:hypothetical protein
MFPIVKHFLRLVLLLLLGASGCVHSQNDSIKEIEARERNLNDSWFIGQLSTYEYLSASIGLAHAKSVIHFRKHKALLTRYPKWVPGLHPRTDTKLRERVVEAYGKGQLDGSEYESLMEQLTVLRERWGSQRRTLTKERFNLRYPR